MTYPVDAAAVQRLLPSQPRVLALGEPTHGEDVLLEVRNALFRQLAPAYRTIALETDCRKALTVDDYVTGGPGTLDDVMAHGFSHGWGAAAPNRDLVQWMRAHNADRPAAQHLRFAGLDGPLELSTGPAAPHEALRALHTQLHDAAVPVAVSRAALDGLLGPTEPWTNPAAVMDPTRSVGRTPAADALRLHCDDLVAVLDANGPTLIAAAGHDGWDRTRLAARTAVGLLRYHHWMADTTPARLPRLVALRATMMATNLLALTDRGPVLAHAHNAHLQRDPSSLHLGGQHLTWWSAGALTEAQLGTGYAYLHTALGTIHHHGVGTPPAGTVEGHLHATLPAGHHLIDPATLTGPYTARVSPWFGYAPVDPAHLPRIDGLLYIRDSPAAGH